MKSLDRIPFLANVLIVACSRPNAEVGKLVKAWLQSRKAANVARVRSAELQGMAVRLMVLQKKQMQQTQRTLPRQSQKRLQTCPPNHQLLTHLPMLTLLLNPEN